MRRNTIVIGAVCLALLAGCSATAQQASEITPTPTPTPTPATLTVGLAGPVYLSAVCIANAASLAVTASFDTNDIAAINAAGAAAREADREAASILDDHEGRWPDGLQDEVDQVIGDLLGEAGWYESIATARNLDEAWAVVYPAELSNREAAQRIRLELDLPSDTMAGCADLGKIIS